MFPGGCASYLALSTKGALQSNWDMSRMTGLWYEYTADWTSPFQIGMRCTTVKYTSLGNNEMSFTNRGYFWPLGGFVPMSFEARALCDQA